MKILCDVHIAYKLVAFLKSKNIEAEHVNNILQKWFTKDRDICRYADEHDYVIVSKDIDFRNSHLISNTPLKLIRIVLGNISTKELIRIFDENLDFFIKNFESKKCYIEVGRKKITVIK